MVGTTSSSSLTEFLVISFAALGGIIVLVGLLMEKFWEKKLYRNISDFWRSKSVREWGEWLVIIGIIVEIGVAVWSALDAWDKIQMAIKNDPLNQPVSDISASMIIKLKGANFIEGPREGSGLAIRGSLINFGVRSGTSHPWIKPGGTFGFFTVTNFGGGYATIVDGNIVDILTSSGFATSEFGVLDSSGFQHVQYPQENNHGYILYFHKHPDAQNSRPNHLTAKELLMNTTWLDIWCDFMPTNAEVISGSAEIIINGGLHLEFQILPKKGQVAVAGVNEWGFALVATNAASPNQFFVVPIKHNYKRWKGCFPDKWNDYSRRAGIVTIMMTLPDHAFVSNFPVLDFQPKLKWHFSTTIF